MVVFIQSEVVIALCLLGILYSHNIFDKFPYIDHYIYNICLYAVLLPALTIAGILDPKLALIFMTVYIILIFIGGFAKQNKDKAITLQVLIILFTSVSIFKSLYNDNLDKFFFIFIAINSLLILVQIIFVMKKSH